MKGRGHFTQQPHGRQALGSGFVYFPSRLQGVCVSILTHWHSLPLRLMVFCVWMEPVWGSPEDRWAVSPSAAVTLL